MSNCLIDLIVLAIEASCHTVVFCETVHWECHTLLAGWCSSQSCAEWCQCRIQCSTSNHDDKGWRNDMLFVISIHTQVWEPSNFCMEYRTLPYLDSMSLKKSLNWKWFYPLFSTVVTTFDILNHFTQRLPWCMKQWLIEFPILLSSTSLATPLFQHRDCLDVSNSGLLSSCHPIYCILRW
jgi:hypothetical protein